MSNLPMDKSTGYVSVDELVELAEPPAGFAGGDAQVQSTLACAIASVTAVSVISQAAGDNCPSTACTSRCAGT
ncbi:class II lanthipeptide, LchA2/BrtA2 family [Nocardiopsis sp. RSe5-2]|uniref:Class II lanthipeptide, LchA2/BrtA2 family n=1 Tax=Nocardiopsis endophytica TaxID=3018445 RepID=A0ABT4U4Y2_9ACTN|nr:class II lanthipeptide, LchA2/BrtA2 family [Nocardiopsis endophytica]MDA2811549.1 class II lanthipeptide, LchA2/BrtA2 family [Nocardiopsis endophytica]